MAKLDSLQRGVVALVLVLVVAVAVAVFVVVIVVVVVVVVVVFVVVVVVRFVIRLILQLAPSSSCGCLRSGDRCSRMEYGVGKSEVERGKCVRNEGASEEMRGCVRYGVVPFDRERPCERG